MVGPKEIRVPVRLDAVDLEAVVAELRAAIQTIADAAVDIAHDVGRACVALERAAREWEEAAPAPPRPAYSDAELRAAGAGPYDQHGDT